MGQAELYIAFRSKVRRGAFPPKGEQMESLGIIKNPHSKPTMFQKLIENPKFLFLVMKPF